MRSSLSLGKIFGIPVRLHFTWFFIFILITASLIAYLPVPGTYVLWYRIIFGIIASLLFFISILAHELAHSLVAIKNNIPVKGITLFVFGGVSHITKEASRPTIEILTAIIGPLVSVAIAGMFLGVYLLLTEVNAVLATVAQWLAYINTLMAMFNLIPGFPLDGGRVFRSLIWLNTGDYIKATRIATISGRIIGYIFIAGGIITMFILLRQDNDAWFAGLWLAFIGWFLETSATISYRDALLRDALSGLTIRDIMSADFPVISHGITLNELVQNHMLPTGHRWFVVATDGKLEGITTIQDIKKVPRNRWSTTSIKEIMTPSKTLITANPDQDALSLLETIVERNINQVPVIEEGKVIGTIAQDSLMRLPQIRSDLKL